MLWLGFAESARARRRAKLEGGGEQSAGEEANELLMALAPWFFSFLMHAAMILLAIFLAWSIDTIVVDEDIIIPSTQLAKNPGVPPVQIMPQSESAESSSSASQVARTALAARFPTGTTSLSTASSSATPNIGMGLGSGQTNAFTRSGASSDAPRAELFGLGGNAMTVVYLVDASGSLIDTLPFVITELKRSINELVERQRFGVIFFQGTEPIIVPPPRMRQATADGKRRAIDWISLESGNVVPTGGSSPVKALEIALRWKPDLIFILSDNITGEGIYEVDQRQLLRQIRDTNKGVRAAKINTIQFLYPDPLKKYGLPGTLEQIATDSGGLYKFLDGRELNIE